MFSVLILNKISTESFNEYYPLFLDAIKSNDVAVCRWYESGGDIDSVLPDLHELTDHKKEWRAVIVKVDDDIGVHPQKPENPFDYICNQEEKEHLEESEIPLIRLTHYLGGFPSPKIEFVPCEICEEGKASRVVYKPVRNEDDNNAYRILSDKYSYDGRRPSEIVLITLRKHYTADPGESMRYVWGVHNESEGSDFWSRNGYPSNCRFIVYDMSAQGPVQRDADMFSFWSMVSLLSTNDIDSDFLQAYRLYRGGVEFDFDSMKSEFQSTATYLIGARNYVEKSVNDDIEKRLSAQNGLPNYEVSIPVSIDAPNLNNFSIKAGKFRLTPRSQLEDNERWGNMKVEAFRRMDECIDDSERALDESAYSMRQACEFHEAGIKPLDKFQKKNMESELASTYSRIIMLQGRLPKTSIHYQDKLADSEKKIKRDFVKRIKESSAISLIGIVVAMIFVGIIPAAYCCFAEDFGKISAVVGVFALSIIVLGLIEFVILLLQKNKLDTKIKDYNNILTSSVGELKNNAKLYSDFISAIASYTKGKSYLKKLSTMTFKDDSAYIMQRRHIKAINSFLNKLNRWVSAFDLDVSFDPDDDVNFSFDYDVKPQYSNTYSIASNREKKITINDSGNYIYSNFEFIERLNLEREELYNDTTD